MKNVRERLGSFKKQIDAFSMARTPLQIQNFVVGQYESRFKQWHQIMIECDAKYQAIANAEAEQRLTALDIEELELKRKTEVLGRLDQIHNERLDIEIQRKKNQLASLEVLMRGALKEVALMMDIAEKEFSDFFGKSEDELYRDHELPYWRERLARQIQVDLVVFGRVQAGNLEALLKFPKKEQSEILTLAAGRKDDFSRLIFEVNQKLIASAEEASNGDCKIKSLPQNSQS